MAWKRTEMATMYALSRAFNFSGISPREIKRTENAAGKTDGMKQ